MPDLCEEGAKSEEEDKERMQPYGAVELAQGEPTNEKFQINTELKA